MAAQLRQRPEVVGRAAHGSVQAEAVDVGAKVLLEVRIPGHGALYRQHLLASTRTEGDAVSTRRSLQRPEHAGLVRITVVVGHVGRTLVFDQRPRRVSSFIVRVMILCNTACSASSVGTGASMNSGAPSVPRRYTPGQHHAVQVGVEIRG